MSLFVEKNDLNLVSLDYKSPIHLINIQRKCYRFNLGSFINCSKTRPFDIAGGDGRPRAPGLLQFTSWARHTLLFYSGTVLCNEVILFLRGVLANSKSKASVK